MKKLFKKYLAVAMVVVIALTAAPLSGFVGWSMILDVSAEDTIKYTQDIYTYTVENEVATIVDCDQFVSGEIIIPSTLGGYTVEYIGSSAFSYCEEITKVTVPSTVKVVYSYAFGHCTKLADIVLPTGITYISDDVFNYTEFYDTTDNWENGVLYCGNYLITANKEAPAICIIKDGITVIAYGAFGNICPQIEEIVIPDSVKHICSFAFGYTNLKSITIGSGVEYIGESAFWCCDKLESVYYNGTVADWCNIEFDKVVFEGYYISEMTSGNPLCYANNLYINNTLVTDLVIPEGITEIKDTAFLGCTSIKTVSFPSTLNKIGLSAFSNCIGIENITVNKDNATYSSDENGILYNKDKTVLLQYPPAALSSDFDIPNTVETLGDSSFESCQNLTSIAIPDSVATIGNDAFSFCTKLDNVIIPNSVNDIGSSVFYKCENLSSIKLSDNLTKISAGLFEYCKALKSIVLPQNITSIGGSAFYCCTGLESIDIPVGVTEIGSNSFYQCTALKDINLPDNLITVGQLAFGYTAVKSVVLPETVTEIGYGAFESCNALESVTISGSVKSLGSSAFSGCSALNSVVFGENSQLEVIEYGTFSACISLTEIEIPDAVKSIEDNAFNGCLNLKSVFGGNNIEEICVSAFEDTSYYLNEDNWDNGVFYVGSALLEAKSSAISGEYIIKAGTKAIADSAFNDCYNLVSVTIPDSVINIGESAFWSCDNLQSVTLPKDLKEIKHGTFGECYSLADIEIPEKVTSIGSDAFERSKIESVTIPASVEELLEYAFRGCAQLKEINVSAGNTNYSSENGVLYNKNKTELIQYPLAKLDTTFKIPDSVATIKSEAFSGNSCIENIICGDNLTDIGHSTFRACNNLKTVSFSENLKTIGYEAFYSCALEKVYIPQSVVEIGTEAFAYNALEEIVVDVNNSNYLSENGVLYNKDKTALLQFPICNESITDFEVPEGVVSVASGAFTGSKNLLNIKLADSVKSIGAISNCYNLSGIEIGTGLKEINGGYYDYDFLADCPKLKTIRVDKNNKYFTTDTFGVLFNKNMTELIKYPVGSEYTSYSIPNGTLYTTPYSFQGIVNLRELSVPVSIKRFTAPFGYADFDYFDFITFDIYYDGSETQWNDISSLMPDGVNIHFDVSGDAVDDEKVKTEVVIDNDENVSVEYNTNFNDGNVALDVERTFDGTAFDIISSETEITQNIIYDIKMTIDGIETQPKGTVTVKIPLPSGYDPNRTYVYYVNTTTGMVENMKAKFVDGYLVFETNHFSYYAVVETPNTYTEQFYGEIKIKQPSTTTINYGDTLVLHAEFGETQLPDGYSILWTVEGNGVSIKPSDDGLTCNVTSVQNGNVTVKATVVDENGEAILDADGNEISASQQLNSKVNFWQKIVSFFKNLFRISRIILQYK